MTTPHPPRPLTEAAATSPHFARCAELGHPGETYAGGRLDTTWCRCGAKTYAGDRSGEAGHEFCCGASSLAGAWKEKP